ncbi:hypothetical protein CAPTEDRAFT_211520 [Capitella teleta]|uniref:Uncharacterized protein n=1 Tax=Capitella teleta TaxID=283909 RepID=R7T4A3_CAPTE|nr:hypothetical protein CAPTEDRAFT_211520 [Capitella teleta]|eukprot:ELT87683.1 hypothetical protein CAPTEDRAFT_211520 [Capitella teleta]
MDPCWSEDPKKRPTFEEITRQCGELFHEDEDSEFYYGPARQTTGLDEDCFTYHLKSEAWMLYSPIGGSSSAAASTRLLPLPIIPLNNTKTTSLETDRGAEEPALAKSQRRHSGVSGPGHRLPCKACPWRHGETRKQLMATDDEPKDHFF